MKANKPIFIIKFPKTEFGKLSINRFNDIREELSEQLYDYHVLIFLSDVIDFEFECFNPKDMSSIDLEELKKKLIKE